MGVSVRMAFSKSKALLFPTPNPIFEKAMFLCGE